MPVRSLAVFCGSKNGNKPIYAEAAHQLGHLLGMNKIEIVYGGGSAGIMGSVADAALGAGGRVVGIIPQLLVEWEVAHRHLSELIVCDDMHRRKQMMYARCEAVCILPGGFGTLDELFEVLTWNQLTIHDKPILVLNSDNFFEHLLQHMQFLQRSGFLYEGALEKISVVQTPSEVLNWLDQREAAP